MPARRDTPPHAAGRPAVQDTNVPWLRHFITQAFFLGVGIGASAEMALIRLIFSSTNACILAMCSAFRCEKRPWNFMYSDAIGRSVAVDSRGILEALRNVYGATALADELAGAAPKPAAEHKH